MTMAFANKLATASNVLGRCAERLTKSEKVEVVKSLKETKRDIDLTLAEVDERRRRSSRLGNEVARSA